MEKVDLDQLEIGLAGKAFRFIGYGLQEMVALKDDSWSSLAVEYLKGGHGILVSLLTDERKKVWSGFKAGETIDDTATSPVAEKSDG